MGKVPRTVPNGTTSELEADLSALLVLSESEFGYGLRNAYTRPGWVEPKSARKWSKRVGDTVSPAFSPHIQSTSSLLCTDFRDSCTGMRRHVPGHAEESLNVHGMGAPGRCGRSGVRSGGSGGRKRSPGRVLFCTGFHLQARRRRLEPFGWAGGQSSHLFPTPKPVCQFPHMLRSLLTSLAYCPCQLVPVVPIVLPAPGRVGCSSPLASFSRGKTRRPKGQGCTGAVSPARPRVGFMFTGRKGTWSYGHYSPDPPRPRSGPAGRSSCRPGCPDHGGARPRWG